MLPARESQTTFVPFHPAEACVEFPLLLREEHLTELEQKARSARQTVGQLIRQALGLYLAGVHDRCGADAVWGDSRPDTPSRDPDALAVTLLLPASRLAELEAVARRGDTTACALIRRVVCGPLLGRPAGEQPPNESRAR